MLDLAVGRAVFVWDGADLVEIRQGARPDSRPTMRGMCELDVDVRG